MRYLSEGFFIFDSAPAEAVYDVFTIISASHLGMDTRSPRTPSFAQEENGDRGNLEAV